jgi:hypothetical protein
MSDRKFLSIGNVFISAFIACFVLLVLVAAGAESGPALTETLTAGPYTIDVNLYQNPPVTDQSVKVTVVPQDKSVPLSGSIVVQPGLGTDAVPLHSQLSLPDQSGTLVGSIRMPVQGSWQVVVQLTGAKGTGSASFLITVAAPGAIPVWLAWLIALVPTPAIAWLIWHQFRYRRRLLQAKVVGQTLS